MSHSTEHNRHESDASQGTSTSSKRDHAHLSSREQSHPPEHHYPAPKQGGGALKGFLAGMVFMVVLGLVGAGWFFLRRPAQEATVTAPDSSAAPEAVEADPVTADPVTADPSEATDTPQSTLSTDAASNQAAAGNLPPAQTLDMQINHPNGSTARLTSISFTESSIVADLTVTNGFDRAITLNRSDGMVIIDSAGNQYNLAAPPSNETIQVDPGTTLEGQFVFMGRLAPGVSSLSVITNNRFGGNQDFSTNPKLVFQVEL
ncbi:hypothetical protein [Vacuolonema iberomarrocanum]|uniref:hypothetical protein n=1 Tax=Vacuolonema iberomarrocanum TaxID=3454632 RepID=UPI0019EB21C6|nr:hypothetical protein [filamentous cyanobacterium LEGE 07170]